MKRLTSLIQKNAGFLIVLLFLVVHLTLINDYGFTWDFHFHFFGGGKLLGYEPSELEPRNLPFVEPDPRKAWTLPYGPLMSIPPVASYLLFHKTLKLLPADSAYHLPIILWGVAGIGILYYFLKEAFNARVAILAALFLGLMPRYFGDLHNNMKDVPSAAVFALSIWLLWRLVRYRRPKDLLWAAVAFAVAFNVKVNSIFIPVIGATWLISLWMMKKRAGRQTDARGGVTFRRIVTALAQLTRWRKNDLDLDDARITARRPQRNILLLNYFLLAPFAAFLLWSLFWPDPLGQLKHAWLTFGVGTNNIEVILNGNWYCSGKNVPWYYPYWYLTITTPFPILVLFVVGLISAGSVVPRSGINATSALIIMWFFLPLTRYFIPKIGVIDGVRHFEEVLFPLSALAALGADTLTRFLKNKIILFFVFIFTIYYLIFNIVSYHPYQITYFNELVGGVKGAFGKYDLDYWGTSQKAAIEWVNKNAPPNAKVHLVMAAAVAGQYLRPDLITNLNKFGYDDSDFVVILNRQSFLYRFFYAYEYLLHHRPIHTIKVKGAPLVWIFDNRTDNRTPRQNPWWQDEDPCIIKYWRGERLLQYR